MIRMPMDNPEGAVDAFDEHEAHELVRVGQFAEGDVLVGAGEDGLAEAKRAADDEDDIAFAGGSEFVDFVGEFDGVVLLALDCHREDVALFRDFARIFSPSLSLMISISLSLRFSGAFSSPTSIICSLQ